MNQPPAPSKLRLAGPKVHWGPIPAVRSSLTDHLLTPVAQGKSCVSPIERWNDSDKLVAVRRFESLVAESFTALTTSLLGPQQGAEFRHHTIWSRPMNSPAPVGARLIAFPADRARMIGFDPMGVCARPDDWAIREAWWAIASQGDRLPAERGVIVFNFDGRSP